MEAASNALLGWFAYRALSNWPGIVLIVLAVLGLLVLLWKHGDASSFRFSFRRVLDVWALGIITVCLLVGVGLVARDAWLAAHKPPDRSFWQCLTE